MSRRLNKAITPWDEKDRALLHGVLTEALSSMGEQPWHPDHAPTPEEYAEENQSWLETQQERDDCVFDLATALGYTRCVLETTVLNHGSEGLRRVPHRAEVRAPQAEGTELAPSARALIWAPRGNVGNAAIFLLDHTDAAYLKLLRFQHRSGVFHLADDLDTGILSAAEAALRAVDASAAREVLERLNNSQYEFGWWSICDRVYA